MGIIRSEHGGHTLNFNEEEHVYKLDWKVVPGVTTMLKASLPTSFNLTNWMIGKGAEHVVRYFQNWRTNEDEFPSATQLKELVKASKTAYKKDSAVAASIGSIVHDYAYYHELGNTEKTDALSAAIANHPENIKINHGIDKYMSWKGQNKDEIIAAEAIVGSVKHKFAGKFDRLARRNGRVVLSDFKTSSGIYADMFIQLGAYAVLIGEWMDIKVEEVEILRFGKEKGDFEVRGFDKKSDVQKFMDQAIRCRETYEFMQKMEKRLGK